MLSNQIEALSSESLKFESAHHQIQPKPQTITTSTSSEHQIIEVNLNYIDKSLLNSQDCNE